MMTKTLAQIGLKPTTAIWLAVSCVALLLVVGCATSPPENVAPNVSARTTTQVERAHPPRPTPAEYKVLVEKNREAKRAFLLKLKKYIEEDGGDPERLNELFGGTGKVLSSPWFKDGVKYQLSTPIWPTREVYIRPQTGNPNRRTLVMWFSDDPLPLSNYPLPKTCVDAIDEIVPAFKGSGWTAKKYMYAASSQGLLLTFQSTSMDRPLKLRTGTGCVMHLSVDY